MKYDFTSITDRHGKDSIAVDALTGSGFAPAPPKDGFDIIPMWVADMNFPTVPTVPEAIIKRTQHPFYGYFSPSEEYFDKIIRWHETRNHVTGLTKECIGYENSVLGGGGSPHRAPSPPRLPLLRRQEIKSFSTAPLISALPTASETMALT